LKRIKAQIAILGFLSVALPSCGGGGMRVASMPTPLPAAVPASAVDIFPNPTTQEFATTGIGSPIRIRYDSGSKRYEVMVGGGDWKALVGDEHSAPQPGSPRTNFVMGLDGYFMIRAHYNFPPESQYRYSNLAVWAFRGADPQAGQGGITAFGMPTPSTGIPLTGSAAYQGMIEGVSGFQCACGWDGETTNAGVGGTVSLSFDFGKGTLAGALQPYLDAEKRYTLGPLAFSNTVFSVGSQAFSGSFATNVSGPNSFSGQFTGPNAEELIGKWAFPFASPVDGSPKSAEGAMIAKRP
jgi:hypothetical protein